MDLSGGGSSTVLGGGFRHTRTGVYLVAYGAAGGRTVTCAGARALCRPRARLAARSASSVLFAIDNVSGILRALRENARWFYFWGAVAFFVYVYLG